MRAVSLPAKPIDGDAIRSALVMAGVPLAEWAIIRRGDQVVIVVNTPPDDPTHDAAVTAVYTAHVAPAERTEAELRRAAAKAVIDEVKEAVGAAVRAVFLELVEALRDERAAYNALRADLRNNRLGAAGTAPALPVPTVEQAVNAVKSRLDSIITSPTRA